MTTKVSASLLIALLLIAGPAFFDHTARAADFVFNVPVELHHINAGAKRWTIIVTVCDANWADGANITSMIVAQGSASFDVVNGEYIGTVTVPCVTMTGRNPADGAVYVVDVQFTILEYPYHMLGNHASAQYACDYSKPCNVRFARQMPNYTGFTRAPK
jgi:hypothetical protein